MGAVNRGGLSNSSSMYFRAALFGEMERTAKNKRNIIRLSLAGAPAGNSQGAATLPRGALRQQGLSVPHRVRTREGLREHGSLRRPIRSRPLGSRPTPCPAGGSPGGESSAGGAVAGDTPPRPGGRGRRSPLDPDGNMLDPGAPGRIQGGFLPALASSGERRERPPRMSVVPVPRESRHSRPSRPGRPRRALTEEPGRYGPPGQRPLPTREAAVKARRSSAIARATSGSCDCR